MSLFDHFNDNELAILRQRAQSIAASKVDDEGEQIINGLRCRVGQGWYVIPLDQLSAIYRQVNVIPVPDAPPTLCGVANVRGRIVPVMHLAEMLAIHEPKPENGELIVVIYEQNTLALLVTTVDDVVSFTQSDLEMVPNEIQANGVSAALIDGTLLLDLEPLLASPNLIIDTQFR